MYGEICETYPRYSIILIKTSLESRYSYSFAGSVCFGWLNVRGKFKTWWINLLGRWIVCTALPTVFFAVDETDEAIQSSSVWHWTSRTKTQLSFCDLADSRISCYTVRESQSFVFFTYLLNFSLFCPFEQ